MPKIDSKREHKTSAPNKKDIVSVDPLSDFVKMKFCVISFDNCNLKFIIL